MVGLMDGCSVFGEKCTWAKMALVEKKRHREKKCDTLGVANI